MRNNLRDRPLGTSEAGLFHAEARRDGDLFCGDPIEMAHRAI
jgi:hypothetical protein